MKQTTMKTEYTYQTDTVEAASRIPAGCVNEQSHKLGMQHAEPLIVALDSMIRYAKAHEARFASPLAEDYVLGPQFLDAVKGLRGLLNGHGAVGHEMDRSTDSKDNGACEAMFWAALEAAGYTEETADL